MTKRNIVNRLILFFKKNSVFLPVLISFAIITGGYFTLNKNKLNPENDFPLEVLSDAKILAYKDWVDRTGRLAEISDIIRTQTTTNSTKEININYFWKIQNLKIDVSIDSIKFAKLKNEISKNQSIFDQIDFEYEENSADSTATLEDLIIISEIMRVVKDNKVKFKDVGLRDFRETDRDVENLIVSYYKEGVTKFEYENEYEFRYANIVIIISAGMIFSFLLLQIPKIGSGKSDIIRASKRKELESKDLPNILFYDIQVSEEKADELYYRSSIMLVSGIVIATVGIIVFSLSLPETKAFEQLKFENYAMESIRPSLMLIFIESIAFYLLKQYRVLIEDFKYFHKLFLQRINYAQCYQLVHDYKVDKDSKATLIAFLLNEQANSKLRDGETTEHLEGMKLADQQNPSDILKKISEIVLQANKSST